jgi:hypothetical protein
VLLGALEETTALVELTPTAMHRDEERERQWERDKGRENKIARYTYML